MAGGPPVSSVAGMDSISDRDAAVARRVLPRGVAACAVLGPIVLAASFAPHGDLPTNESRSSARRARCATSPTIPPGCCCMR
jgi:hypothetical protein